MKSFKKILVLAIMLVTLCVVGCKKDKPIETFAPTAISTILSEYTPNKDVQIEGVVYGVIKNGFYVADANDCGIFVVMGDNWSSNVKVNDKVQITGKFSYVDSFPQINNVKTDNIKVVASNQTCLYQPQTGTIEEIAKMVNTVRKGNYGKIVNLTAVVSKESNNMISLLGDTGAKVDVNAKSNVSSLEEFLNKRVDVKVIVHGYNIINNTWIVAFTGATSDIKENVLSFDSILESANDDITKRIPTEVYGALNLPSAHSTLSFLTYQWTVEANEYVSIDENNRVTINLDEADHTIEFTCTVSNGTESGTLKFNITSKAIIEQSVSNLLANVPVINYSTVSVRAIVVGMARNQSLSLRSFVIQDPTTKETTTVDFSNDSTTYINNTSDEFKAVKVGDEIIVTGQYRNTSRTTIMNVAKIEIVSSNNSFTHDFDNAFELNDEESYAELGANYDNYLNKLVKISRPFMNYSTSTVPSGTNWVRLGHNADAPNAGYNSDSGKRNFAFLIDAQNENLGSDEWHTSLNIPFVNETAMQYNLDIYAYVIYVSASYIAFIIPDYECYQPIGSDKVVIDIANSLPVYLDLAEGNQIELPTSHQYAPVINWSVDKTDIFDLATMTVKNNLTHSTKIKLTATFEFNNETIEKVFEVDIIPAGTDSIENILALEESQAVRVSGVVIAYVSDGNNVATRHGVLIMDNITGATIMVNGISKFGGTYGAYTDSTGNVIELGDEITVIGSYNLSTAAIGSGPDQTKRNHIEVAVYGNVEITQKNVNINWQLDNVLTIASNADLIALADDLQFGTIIKFVGTADNPIYLGGSSNSLPFNIKVFMTPATSNNDTKYNGQTFALKSDVNIPNGGENWYRDALGISGAFVGPTSTNRAIPIYGEIYTVIGYHTSTYYQMSVVAYDEWKVTIEESKIEGIIGAYVPDSIGEEGWDCVLPLTSRFVDGEITWTSSNENVINLGTKTVTPASANTVVTLTATMTINNEVKTFEYSVTVIGLGDPDPISVSSALAAEATVARVIVDGIFVAYQTDGNSNGILRGIIIMDKTTKELLIVDGMQSLLDANETHGIYYASDGETLLKFGDEVRIDSQYVVDGTRKSLVVEASSVVTILSSNNSVTYGTPTVTITNDEELAAFVANPQFGVLIKFVGTTDSPFCVGGSSSTASAINYKFGYRKDATVKADFQYGGKDLSFKGAVNVLNAGANWWSEKFGLPQAAFVAPSTTRAPYQLTGETYGVLTTETSAYFQFALVNIDASTMSVIPTE